MKQGRHKYKDLQQVMTGIISQVKRGTNYGLTEIPDLGNDPAEIWNWLKPQLIYQKDPLGVELLQSLPTLLTGRKTGTPGAGDCDCFVIAALTIFNTQPAPPPETFVMLAGTSARYARHIYLKVNGQDFDLTAPFIGVRADHGYKYFQALPVNYQIFE